MISFRQKGDFSKLEKMLKNSFGKNYRKVLEQYGREGVAALAAATPKDSGKTAASWEYEIVEKSGQISIIWKNTNVNKGVNIAVILQYGHGTRNGGYVQGIDYINPALRPIFEKIADAGWKEVSAL